MEDEDIQALLDILDSVCSFPIEPYLEPILGAGIVDVGRCKFCGSTGQIRYLTIELTHKPVCATILLQQLRKRLDEKQRGKRENVDKQM